jgi:hypothetical protein
MIGGHLDFLRHFVFFAPIYFFYFFYDFNFQNISLDSPKLNNERNYNPTKKNILYYFDQKIFLSIW